MMVTNSSGDQNQSGHDRLPFDLANYIESISTGPCFICEIIKGNPRYQHHIIHEDEDVIVFLNKFPVLLGYVLVAPRRHLEQVTGDVTLEEYLTIQKMIYRVGEAVRKTFPTERLYILSLGSQQGNRHIHWHIAPLPPGVPFVEQQGYALSVERGILALTEADFAKMAVDIKHNLT